LESVFRLRNLRTLERDLERRFGFPAPGGESALRVRDQPRIALRTEQLEIPLRDLRREPRIARRTRELGLERSDLAPLGAVAHRQTLEHLCGVARDVRRSARAGSSE